MSNAHTPGPWEARGLTIWEPGRTSLSIAVVTQHERNARANARLIAAAPDMLAALRGILDDAKAYGMADSAFSGSLIEAAAAIAKTEGRT